MSAFAFTAPASPPAVHSEQKARRGSPCTIIPFRPAVVPTDDDITPLPRPMPDIASLLPLVRKIASWFERKWGLPAGWEHDDLVDIGVIGLMLAAKRFDPTRGCSIETYAGYAIRGAIFRQMKERWTDLNHEAPPPSDEVEAPWPPPEKAVLYREVVDAVFTRLSDVDQTLVVGRLDEQTFAELGRRLRMPITTACRQHERALRRLRTALGSGYNPACPS